MPTGTSNLTNEQDGTQICRAVPLYYTAINCAVVPWSGYIVGVRALGESWRELARAEQTWRRPWLADLPPDLTPTDPSDGMLNGEKPGSHLNNNLKRTKWDENFQFCHLSDNLIYMTLYRLLISTIFLKYFN